MHVVRRFSSNALTPGSPLVKSPFNAMGHAVSNLIHSQLMDSTVAVSKDITGGLLSSWAS